jgi:gliding motility-associated-like protein
MMPRSVLFVIFFLIAICVYSQSPPPPTITSFTPASTCQGYQVVITGTNFTGVSSVTLGTQAAASFTINSPTSITATVAEYAGSGPVTVDGVNGGNITIKASPKPSLKDLNPIDAPFTNCDGNKNYTLKIENNSVVTGTGYNYEINWGDGSTPFTQLDWPLGAQLTHAFNAQGYFIITLKISAPNGCDRIATYQFYNGQNPIASITTTNSTTGLCAPAPVEFQIGNWFLNSPGTEYILDYGDNTPLVTLPHPLNTTNTIFKISHTYNKSSCPRTDFTAILYTKNGCYTTTYTLNQIVIRSKPVADFFVNTTFCLNDDICVSNKSNTGTSGNFCSSSTDYEWDFGDGFKSTLRDPACHKYAAAGNYKITLKATSATCGTDTKSIDIKVLPNSPLPVVTTPVVYCQGATAVSLNATGTSLKWYTAGGTLLTGTPTPATAVPGNTTYYVTQTLPGQCESPKAAILVTVNPLPAKPGVTSPVSLCQGTTATPLTATGTGLKWYAADGSSLPAAPTPATAAVGSTSYYVTQTSNNCEGPKAEIIVNIGTLPATPAVNTPVNYCQGQTAYVLTASGTGLKWYNAGGTLLPGAPVPATSSAGTTTYYVSQSNGCGESPRAAITVNVNPAPTAAISYSPATLCNAAGSPVVNVTQTGSTGGTYSAPAGLTINATNGAITPATSSPGNYTIRYTVTGTGGCANVVATTTVTVNSTPQATISYPAMCSSDGLTAVTIIGSAGGVFSSTAGLSINPATGAITPATSTSGNYTVTYDIPAAAPCPGFQTTTNISITKAPAATISYTPATLCNTSSSAPVNVTRTGDAGGTYSITPAGLTIDPATGTLSPAGASADNYTIRYTLTGSGGCNNVIAMTTVTVSSTPTASITYAGNPYCGNLSTAQAVTQTGNKGGTYSAPAGLSIDAASGAITPSTSTPGTYTVTYTIAAAPPCPGYQASTNITITRPLAATISYTPATLCNNSSSATVNVTRTGDAGGTYSISPQGMTIDPATGTLSPAGASAGNYTIRYTLPGGGGCANVVATTNVTVNSTPIAAISYAGSPYCGNISSQQAVTQTGTPGGKYTSSPGLLLDANTGAIIPAGSTPGNYTITYTIAPAPPCPGFQTNTNVTVYESPLISFPVADQEVCSNQGAIFTPTSSVPNTNYSWAVSGNLPSNVNGVSSGNFTGNLSLLYTNSGNNDVVITVRVIPYNPQQTTCAGAAYDLHLTVHPEVPPPVSSDVSTCMGAAPVTLQATGLPGHTIRWYDAQQNLLAAAPVIPATDSLRRQYYVNQRSSFGCEGPKIGIIAIVHPTLKITGADFTHPTACGIPSGTIVLQTRDLSDQIVGNVPVIVHYKKFQADLVSAGFTDSDGKITLSLTAGSYTDFYAESTGGCTTAHLNDVFVLKDPDPPAKPVAGYNPPVCSEMPLTLTALSATSPQAGEIEYVWAGPAFGPYPDTVNNTVMSFASASMTDAGTYVVYATQHNCISAADSFIVVINRSPSKPVISTRSPLCAGDELYLSASSGIGDNSTLTYLWTGPGRGFPVNGTHAVIDKVILTDAGRYAITVTAAETGCASTTDTLIEIGNYPVIQFATDTLILPTGFKITLAPAILNATEPGIMPIQNYTWTPADDLACNDAICDKPILTVKNDACYAVKASNVYGCSDSDTICVKAFCKDAQVFVPNAFTPDGLPENRILMVRASGIATVRSFRVFNRWGRVMYERSNFAPNSSEYGWNGYINGKKADTGVYVYTVEVVCENGTPYTVKGNVTLF